MKWNRQRVTHHIFWTHLGCFVECNLVTVTSSFLWSPICYKLFITLLRIKPATSNGCYLSLQYGESVSIVILLQTWPHLHLLMLLSKINKCPFNARERVLKCFSNFWKCLCYHPSHGRNIAIRPFWPIRSRNLKRRNIKNGGMTCPITDCK